MRKSHRIRALLPVALLSILGSAFPASAQVFHRPRCARDLIDELISLSRPFECPDSVFELELERVVLTEGPLASDRDEDGLRYLRQRIQAELETDPANEFLWLALSEAELGLGDPVPAVAAARRAMELGADSSLALRAEGAARMRMPGNEREGAIIYFEGLARLTEAAAPRYLADMAPILSQDELDWWRSTDLETLRTWARDYWEHRAALAGVMPEDRLAEHIRRSAAAARLFAPPGTGSGAVSYDAVLHRSDLRMLPYDDRGLVYIRRGPPHEELRVSADVFSGLPATTWLYSAVEGSVDAFHFARDLSSGSGFRLVVAPACDPGYIGSGMSGGMAPVAEGWVMTGAGVSADASRTAVSCFSGDAQSNRANAALNAIAMRREAMRALAVESPREPFRRPLPAFFDFYAFRGPNGETEVLTPVVVPVGSDAREPIDLMVTFADRTGGVVRREATSASTRTEVQQSILSGGEGWGVAYVQTVVRPTDEVSYRIVVRDARDPERGGMWGGSMPVRSFAGPGLRMSDVVVSGEGPATWSRGTTRLFLLPARSFAPGAPVIIFYELYDIAPGSSYRTELTLRPDNDNVGERLWRALTGSGQIRVHFEGQVPEDVGSVFQELRSLELPADEGTYTLTVRVTNQLGQSVESTRAITISEDAAMPAGGASEVTEESTEE